MIDSNAQIEEHHEPCKAQKSYKSFVVARPNAIVKPPAMVVKSDDALVTPHAVFCAGMDVAVTNCAKSQL